MMSSEKVKAEAKGEAASVGRPLGLTFSSLFLGIAGVYYLLYPFLVQDPTIIPLYVLGALSLIGSYGVMRMTRWGLWLGLLLFPVQVIAPAFALQAVIQQSALAQSVEGIGFIASLVVQLFLASLAFLLVIDKRKSFT